MDGAFWGTLAQLGPIPAIIGVLTGIIGVLVLLLRRLVRQIIDGQLVPRSVLEDALAGRDLTIQTIAEERDAWKQAHTVSEEARRMSLTQVDRLTAEKGLGNQLLDALRGRGEV